MHCQLKVEKKLRQDEKKRGRMIMFVSSRRTS